MLGDGTCDTQCNNAQCRYDLEDCLNCNSCFELCEGCYMGMLRDGVC